MGLLGELSLMCRSVPGPQVQRIRSRADTGDNKIEHLRTDVGAKIDGLDARLRVGEQSMESTRVGVADLQVRVRGLEAHARQPAEAAHPPSINEGKG